MINNHDGVTCLCSHPAGRHRTGVRGGQPVRTGCKACSCDSFELNELAEAVTTGPGPEDAEARPGLPEAERQARLAADVAEPDPVDQDDVDAQPPRADDSDQGDAEQPSVELVAIPDPTLQELLAVNVTLLDAVMIACNRVDQLVELAARMPVLPIGAPAGGVLDRDDLWLCRGCGSRYRSPEGGCSRSRHAGDRCRDPLLPITVTVTVRAVPPGGGG